MNTDTDSDPDPSIQIELGPCKAQNLVKDTAFYKQAQIIVVIAQREQTGEPQTYKMGEL